MAAAGRGRGRRYSLTIGAASAMTIGDLSQATCRIPEPPDASSVGEADTGRDGGARWIPIKNLTREQKITVVLILENALHVLCHELNIKDLGITAVSYYKFAVPVNLGDGHTYAASLLPSSVLLLSPVGESNNP